MDYDSIFMQVVLCIIASGTMISSGMNVAFPAVALPAMERATRNSSGSLEKHEAFWIASLPQIAMIIGCLGVGPVLDWRGRKIGLLLSTFLASSGWFLMAILPELWSVYLSRLLTGLAMGLASPAASVFVSEVASPSTRSALTVLKSLAFSFGLTLTYFFGYLYRNEWRMVALLCGVFPASCFILVLAFVEEPKVWKETPRIRKFNFRRPQVIKPMMIMSTALFLNKIAGTSAILSYAVEVVQQAGVTSDHYLVTVYLGVTRLVGGLLALWFSSRLGRRLPATWSGVGMSASMLAIASTFQLPIFALIVYFLTATIHGAVPQAMTAEVFPTDMRGVATSLTTVTIYLTSFISLFIHQWLREEDRPFLFTYYGCLSVASTIYVIMFLPETHGKTFSEIEAMFSKNTMIDESLEIRAPLNPEVKLDSVNVPKEGKTI